MKKLTTKQYAERLKGIRAKIQSEATPFDDDSAGAKKQRICRSLEDKEFFFKTYLPHYFPSAPAGMHQAWDELVDVEGTPVVIAAPRGFGKTVRLTIASTLRDICLKLTLYTLIISQTEDQARGAFTSSIKLELEENERLKADFGDLRGRAGWSDDDFTTKTGIRIKARGRGQRVRGLLNRSKRPDTARVDDFEDNDSVLNQKLTDKGFKWIVEQVWPALAKKRRRLSMVGQLLTKNSVLAQLINLQDPDNNRVCRSGIYDCFDENENSTWPEVHSTQSLVSDRKLMGNRSFNREFRNKPQADDQAFPEEKITYCTQADIDALLANKPRIIGYVDPSMKSGQQNDYKALVVLAYHNLIIYVLHAWIRKTTVNNLFNEMYRLHEIYKPRWGFEDNAIGDFAVVALKGAAEKKGFTLPVKFITHTSAKSARILSMNPDFESGFIRFLKNNSDQKLLIGQLVNYDGAGHDDGPDALEGAISMCKKPGKIRVAVLGGDKAA